MRRVFKISSNFYGHPNVVKAGNAAVGLWAQAASWVASQDSYCVPAVPDSVLRQWTHRPEKLASALVEAGLWEPTQIRLFEDVWEPGWEFVPDDRLFKLQVIVRRAPITSSLRTRVYARDGYACLHCGAADNLTLDHIRPYSKGGPDTYENLQTLCRPCNSSKGARV